MREECKQIIGGPLLIVVHGNAPEATITQLSWGKAAVNIAGLAHTSRLLVDLTSRRE